MFYFFVVFNGINYYEIPMKIFIKLEKYKE